MVDNLVQVLEPAVMIEAAVGMREKAAEGCGAIASAISATGAEMGRPYFSALYADALARAGRPQGGLAEIEQALHVVDTKGARLQLPEILRLKGEVLKLLPHYDADAAMACFRDAMATARTQGAPLLEFRAATSLARLLIHKRRRVEARRLLTDVCRGYEEMPTSVELQDARKLLAQ